MRAWPAIQVVLSTSWREQFDPDEMLDFVTSNGAEDLRDRFVGSTPILAGHPREAECRAWLAANGFAGQPWLALDDDATQFSDLAHLYLVDPRTGLTAANVDQILARLG